MNGTILGYVCSILIACVTGYFLGSLNGAIVSVRLLKQKDIRDYGSKNAGLTNVLRCFGKGCGIITLLIDLCKGAVSMLLTEWIASRLAWAPLMENADQARPYRWLCYLAAIFAILGHVFPIWHQFKGGKGVLVGVSTFLVINPLLFCIALVIFGIVLGCTKYVSVSSCTASAAVVPLTFVLERFQRGTDMGMALFYTAMMALSAAWIIYSHRENIKRLRAGTEHKIGSSKKTD
ncbi:MAG: glycerol-3-phosphate 1-O-acyltransferase PlsY [Oscillospiraceae bacterium]|nr:glycerol-3-phosphate 1-O-acyltransferase PlsY [Oscillospiraceae bacterium]